MATTTVAVLGSGNGGHAFAAILALSGHRVRLYSRYGYERILPAIRERGGIQVSGVSGSGLAPLACVTNDIAEAIHRAELVIVAVPGTRHEDLAALCAPHLSEHHTILLAQGSCGSIFFHRELRKLGRRVASIGETASLPYTCRTIEPAHIAIYRVSHRHLFAALPGRHGPALAERLHEYFPYLTPVSHVLETALYNPNILLHPAGTLLNLGRIEHVNGDFRIYTEGFTPSVWEVVSALDKEKMALLTALGIRAMSYQEEFSKRCIDTFSDFASIGIKGPSGRHDRYITEDVPIGLALMSSVGRLLKVPTPIADSLITLSSAINGVDYGSTGRTLEKLGLSDLDPHSLSRRLIYGEDVSTDVQPARH